MKSEMMQVNGFGYKNMASATERRDPNTIVTNIADGEFQIDFSDGSKSLFTPLQMQFHAPSEHTVDGKYYDLELHIVHYYKN